MQCPYARKTSNNSNKINLIMPSLSNDEIKEAIADGTVFAISVDTAIFDAKQKTFQNPTLRRLDQLTARGVRIVLTDVVANEMKTHLCHEAKETQRKLKKALRSHNIRWNREVGDEEQDYFLINADAKAFAAGELEAFLAHVNGEIIKVSETPNGVEQTLDRYFSLSPPFGPANKQKSEFPDTFALLRLEAFAAEFNKLLICVSPDKGWVKFAAQSDHLVCVDKLEDVLALFNAAVQHVADAIVQRWQETEGGEYIEDIANAFEYRLDDLDFHITGESNLLFEAEPLSGVLQNILLKTIGDPTVIAADDETVTFTVQVDAAVRFEASFNFYFVDCIDKDEVSLGSEDAYVENTLKFDLTITADRSLEDGLIFREVEVAKKLFEVDFGYVQAFPGEDPTHEKY